MAACRWQARRVDLGVELEDPGSPMLVVIEIKGTVWDEIPARRVMRNVRRHLGQLQDYLDTAIEDMEAGSWSSVTGVLLYNARPARTETVETIEAKAAQQAITVLWYEDADWREHARDEPARASQGHDCQE